MDTQLFARFVGGARLITQFVRCTRVLALRSLQVCALQLFMSQALTSGIHAQEQPPPLRRLLVVDGDTVQLGRSLGTLTRFVMFPGDTAVRFPPGMFEGADGAMAFFDSTGTVQRIGFLFGERHNMDTMLGSLYRDHGRTPRYLSVPIPEGVRETWTWSDRETELAFTRFTPSQSSVAALLMVSNLKR